MPKIKTIDPRNLERFLIHNKSDYELIDIRSTNDYVTSHIPTAISLPLDSKLFMDYVPTKKIGIFYCESSRRVAEEQEWLQDIEFSEYYILLGGLNSWRRLLLLMCKKGNCRCSI